MSVIPQDILNNIIEYKESHEHYLKFKIIIDDLPVKSIIRRIESISHYANSNIVYDFYDLLLEKLEEIESIHIIETLNKCNCCERHKNNKPTVKQYYDGFVPNYSTSCNLNNNLCNCPCRHIIRHICRAKNDEVSDF